MARDVREYVSTCDSCQHMKPRNTGKQGVPKEIPDPMFPWDSVMMDFIGPLPETKAGNAQIL
eukprot:4228382-Prorocentrum_lima.AAC.1